MSYALAPRAPLPPRCLTHREAKAIAKLMDMPYEAVRADEDEALRQCREKQERQQARRSEGKTHTSNMVFGECTIVIK